ncbi:DUF262 domain-containing protein [Methylorubrum extorquens]|uniref:DUF262 domain-containing protein n=1 Tax=Methylorubrum extorquens (strain ATCC 14718 / DSM 1338 / JCM 2805 / NCIMB 9133 / AM1) TaxID=272630 RepID=C5B6S0_METEA|nr:DUF262 domain-containing protein [Methylorubrum extorquens]ACS44152.1 conserved hypothetical protein [Methylorubrum extorquens AM1]MCP1546697.1 hypothetical protein [Methylorubrum extorquens]MCP1592036.1 hypothetical protein [Methylorubrum extorquens]
MLSLTAHEKQISQIFSTEYVFNIPGYQRPYSWNREQARDLITDLTDALRESKGKISEMSPYFLGSIVLIKREGSPNADVVDGQQRLTTLTILLAALRSVITTEEGSGITSLIYEKGQIIHGTEDHFRLTLRPRDREFFQTYVQRPTGFAELLVLDGISDTRMRIRDNAKLFQEHLEKMTQAECIRLAQFIVTRCFLVVVSTPDLEAAYRIFSVMNSRGLDLTATDILKADIIGHLDENDRDTYTQKWEAAEEDLGRDAFQDLFSHIRTVYRKAKPQGTLLKEFEEHVSPAHTPRQLIDDVIVPMARIYADLVDESYTSTELAEEVNAYLKWLNRLEFSDWMPPALAFAVRHRNNSAAMRNFLKDLERLAYWMLITRAGVYDRIERFARLTRDIEAGADLYATSSALQLTQDEQLQTRAALDGPIYQSMPARARSIILLRLDSLVSGGGATYDYPTITVEHVLPQTPDAASEWVKWFPEETERQLWVHRLGNLALLTRKKNSSASNYEFSRKKTAYFANNGVSPFPITTQVLQHSEWTPQIVTKRHAELMERLSTHWRLAA